MKCLRPFGFRESSDSESTMEKLCKGAERDAEARAGRRSYGTQLLGPVVSSCDSSLRLCALARDRMKPAGA
jgi:hypothetical protein